MLNCDSLIFNFHKKELTKLFELKRYNLFIIILKFIRLFQVLQIHFLSIKNYILQYTTYVVFPDIYKVFRLYGKVHLH